jgi:hypothetical protein
VQVWQAKSEHLQAQLATSAETLSTASLGIQLAIGAMQLAQERSERAVSVLLGSAYGWEDVTFYGGGVVAVGALGALDATRAARLPLAVVLALSLMTERGVLLVATEWSTVRTSAPTCHVPRDATRAAHLHKHLTPVMCRWSGKGGRHYSCHRHGRGYWEHPPWQTSSG